MAGHKLILSDEGASAYLTDVQGTVYPLVIDQVEEQTMPVTYADWKLTTGELDFDEKPSDGGFVRVATAGGSALYPITYCAH